jgi:mRNA interferase RelE/StbE
MGDGGQEWRINIHREPEKVLRRLPKNLRTRIWAKIRELKTDPRPDGCKKLSGTQYDNLYRVRVSSWRISYAIDDDRLVILVLEIAPRGDAYRRF